MSDNIPSTSSKRASKKYEKSQNLPTPPPDPHESKSDDILDYLNKLQKSASQPGFNRSTSLFAPAIITEEAFVHLEKLYKLMEQMLELREQNAKLRRKVCDLERFNNLEKMQKNFYQNSDGDCELDKDTTFAETILESILYDTKNPKFKTQSNKLRQSILRKPRTRSSSTTEKQPSGEDDDTECRRASLGMENRLGKPSKVSKWTKVKAAFKWEKASPAVVGDAKSQDSGIGGMTPVNLEIARYLRVPSTSEDTSHSPSDLVTNTTEMSTPGTMSTASSNDDFHRNELRTSYDESKTSDDEHSQNYIPRSKDGSQKSNRSFKTSWAKMKDHIIHPRASLKKKHRLSAQSDDIQIDIEFCSDNEEVFEDADQNLLLPGDSTSASNSKSNISNASDIPSDIIERYKEVSDENEQPEECCNGPEKISKWTKVKKAFLTRETPKTYDEAKLIQDEIQQNYQQLQQKLSLEFQEKLNEWERMKQNSPGTSNPGTSGFVDETPDAAFMKKMEEWQKIKSQPTSKNANLQMRSEEELPPEFRRKLEEWKKIKNFQTRTINTPKSKSPTTPRADFSPTIEYPTLTDDFRKKLEEWKQIKAGGNISPETTEQKSSRSIRISPIFSRKNLSPLHHKKYKDRREKELQWFEKELGKIEKEKQRLEKERQKFLEREEKLSKLRNAIAGGDKKEVLIHTSSGFHRFEGISRKFAQKLYEWEKAQGIGPESSTFTLLGASCTKEPPEQLKARSQSRNSLPRSKSADSIVISALNLTCPLMTHQPSSLSLNDVEQLEKECMADSKCSSIQFSEHDSLTYEEPEALIVEVEDFVEESAAPLQNLVKNTQQPIYQREEIRELCEGEMCVSPKIRCDDESKNIQHNRYLINDILNILAQISKKESTLENLQDFLAENHPNDQSNDEISTNLKEIKESQKMLTNTLLEQISQLQDANLKMVTNLDNENLTKDQTLDIIDDIQDYSTELFHMTEKLQTEINIDTTSYQIGARASNPVLELLNEIESKILDLKRQLIFMGAIIDTPRKVTPPKTDLPKKKARLYIKAETSHIQSQGAVKKKIKHRQKNLQQTSTPDSEDDDFDCDQKRNKHRKLTKTKPMIETDKLAKPLEDLVVPAQLNLINTTSSEDKPESPVTVFIKTTRQLFLPLIDPETNENNSQSLPKPDLVQETQKEIVPKSPLAQKKTSKEIAPGIRMMLAKYNQKISEQDVTSYKSAGSSGSASPVAWRSPIAERRVKAQTQKYQADLDKLSPLLAERHDIQKSASAGFLGATKPPTDPAPKPDLKLDINLAQNYHTQHSPEERMEKLKKAKEEFLNSSTPKDKPDELKFPERNRLSQISVDSESSYDSTLPGILIKSASAGMINVDPDTYRQFDPEIHKDGYVSLPRSPKKIAETLIDTGKFSFSHIASKFRKVKMRRNRDHKKGAISTLCRQSLVVDISPTEQSNQENPADEVSISSSKSWIKKPKLFRKF